MVIKKIYLVVLLLSSILIVSAAPTNVDVPNKVVVFISNLERLAHLSDTQRDDAYRLHEQNVHCFYASGNSRGSITIDSDFENNYNSELYYLGLGTVSSSLTYCNKLYTMLYKEKCLKLEHEILYTEAISAPDIDGKDELYFYDTKIKKTCFHNNHAITIWQSFEVEASSGLIVKINGYNTMPSSWLRNNVDNVANQTVAEEPQQYPENTTQVEAVKKMTEQEYLRLAARYYTSRDYATAIATYRKLTTVYPENAEGWFRLALIVRYKTKWSKKAYKNPKQIAISFMKKASGLATGKLKSKADNALFYWENPNCM